MAFMAIGLFTLFILFNSNAVLSANNCNSTKPISFVKNLNVSKLLNGAPWSELVRTTNSFEINGTCSYVTFTGNDRVFFANFSEKKFPGEIRNNTGSTELWISFINGTPQQVHIIATDYDNFVILETCTPISDNVYETWGWWLRRNVPVTYVTNRDILSYVTNSGIWNNYCFINDMPPELTQTTVKEETTEPPTPSTSTTSLPSTSTAPSTQATSALPITNCDKVSNMENINMTRFLIGQPWFEIYRTPNAFEHEKLCTNVSFNCNTAGFQAYFGDNKFVGRVYNNSELLIAFSNNKEQNVFISATDYENYAVLHTCNSNIQDDGFQWMWLLSRTQINAATLNFKEIFGGNDELQQILIKNNICKVIPKGFHVPGRNETFYFAFQFENNSKKQQ